MEKNKVIPKNLEADIRSQDWMCGPKYHSERTASSPNVRSRV